MVLVHGTPWDFQSEVRDAMKGKGETRLAITDQKGGSGMIGTKGRRK